MIYFLMMNGVSLFLSKNKDNSMKIKTIIGLTAVVMLLFLTGCVTDYRAEAAENARKYLIDNMDGLSVLQQNFNNQA